MRNESECFCIAGHVLWSPEFQKLWRSVPVDSIDEEKIEDYLKRQGISSMQETGPKKIVSLPTVKSKMFKIPWMQTIEIKYNTLPACTHFNRFVLCNR